MIDKDAVERGDTVTYLALNGRSECTATVEYTTYSAVHIITAERRVYPVHWHRVTGHTPKAAADGTP